MPYKVLIDPGHGGMDSGAVGYGLKEKDLTLNISLKTAEILRRYKEIEVILTRDRDIYLDLSKRIKPCNVSISVHINSGGGKGLETWISLYNKPKESEKLGRLVHSSILKLVPFNDRGLKMKKSDKGRWDYYYMIREPKGVPILVECGFIDSADDVAILKSRENLDLIAQGIANGVLKYFNINQKEDDKVMGTLFKDVPDNHWAIKDIQWAKDMGLIRGYDDGTYGLGKPITREELAVILHRFYEKFIGGNK